MQLDLYRTRMIGSNKKAGALRLEVQELYDIWAEAGERQLCLTVVCDTLTCTTRHSHEGFQNYGRESVDAGVLFALR